MEAESSLKKCGELWRIYIIQGPAQPACPTSPAGKCQNLGNLLLLYDWFNATGWSICSWHCRLIFGGSSSHPAALVDTIVTLGTLVPLSVKITSFKSLIAFFYPNQTCLWEHFWIHISYLFGYNLTFSLAQVCRADEKFIITTIALKHIWQHYQRVQGALTCLKMVL